MWVTQTTQLRNKLRVARTGSHYISNENAGWAQITHDKVKLRISPGQLYNHTSVTHLGHIRHVILRNF